MRIFRSNARIKTCGLASHHPAERRQTANTAEFFFLPRFIAVLQNRVHVLHQMSTSATISCGTDSRRCSTDASNIPKNVRLRRVLYQLTEPVLHTY